MIHRCLAQITGWVLVTITMGKIRKQWKILSLSNCFRHTVIKMPVENQVVSSKGLEFKKKIQFYLNKPIL